MADPSKTVCALAPHTARRTSRVTVAALETLAVTLTRYQSGGGDRGSGGRLCAVGTDWSAEEQVLLASL